MTSTASTLSPEQQQAMNLFHQGHNLFITGPAGTGKTHIIRQMVNHMDIWGKRDELSVCALTGTAAKLLQCKATTVHSWTGIGLARGPNHKIVHNACAQHRIKDRWRKCKVLIIDEISMMSVKLIRILDEIGKTCRNSLLPFGGVQVVFLGDFYQLPPIGRADEPETGQYCFEWSEWYTTFPLSNHILLRTVFRQRDPLFCQILSEIREGRISESSCEVLYAHVERDMSELKEKNVVPTCILPTRAAVDAINQKRFHDIDAPVSTYPAEIKTNNTMYHDTTQKICLEDMMRCRKLKPDDIEREIESLFLNTPCLRTLNLKPGTVVMITFNLNTQAGIVNGTQGVVVSCEPNAHPVVQLANGQKMQIEKTTWQSEEYPSISITNYPLMMCWAVTIHKCQGATLEYAQVDLGRRVFEVGQSYVGLSRVKSLEGLYLTSFDPKKIIADPFVQEFYERLNQRPEETVL